MRRAIQSSPHPCEIKCLVTRQSPVGCTQTPGKVECRMEGVRPDSMAARVTKCPTDRWPVAWQWVRESARPRATQRGLGVDAGPNSERSTG